MRVVVLSTDTKHHVYFLCKLYQHFDIVGLAYERRGLTKKYATGPFFKNEEDQYEERFFDPSLDGTPRHLPSDLEKRMVEVHSVNQPGLADYIKALQPDVAVTFGVGPVEAAVFSLPPWGTINVHRGMAQEYRGLDSDLWAIYEKRFDQVGVTIHYVDARLDTGDILAQERVVIEPQDEIYHLRYKTTIVATRLVGEVLSKMNKVGGRLSGAAQERAGAYYSAMPLSCKLEALQRFRQYTESLRSAQR